MKKILFCTYFICIAAFVNAQSANCDAEANIAGTLILNQDVVPINQTYFDVTIDGATTALSTLEYAIIDPTLIVGEEELQIGAKVVDASSDGSIDLLALGFEVGDSVCINAAFYDLGNLKLIMDDLFDGVLIGQPCCDLMEVLLADDVCQNLNDSGIMSSGDVNNLDDVIVSLEAFGTPPTVEGVLNIIDSTMNVLEGAPAECAGHLPLCYAVTNRVCFTVGDEATGLEDIENDIFDIVIAPNPIESHKLHISINSEEQGDALVMIHDMQGRTVKMDQKRLTKGQNDLNLDLPGIASGNYFLLIDLNGQQAGRMFVKK